MKLTKRQWQAVYDSASKTYMSSYAMMVGDAMRGFKKFEKKHGLRAYYDGGVFHKIFSLVKHQGIGYNLDAYDVETLNEERELDI